MGKKLDLTSKIFGRLTVLNKAAKTNPSCVKWVCKCECGNYVSVFAGPLILGITRSCGCLKSQRAKETHTKHGHCIGGDTTSEYSSWYSLKDRCYNINNSAYKNYGGRGIIVCDRWLGENGFINFFEDMGPKPSPQHTLDRYPNNDNGIYEKSNCRWATRAQQNRNLRSNVWLEYEGKIMILADWTNELEVHHNSIRYHLNTGKSFNEVVEFIKNKKVN